MNLILSESIAHISHSFKINGEILTITDSWDYKYLI